MTAELLKSDPKIIFVTPPSISDVRLVSFSDSSHGGGEEMYGK